MSTTTATAPRAQRPSLVVADPETVADDERSTAELRRIAALAAAFEAVWRSGSGRDTEACDAADALRAALDREEGSR